MINFEIIFYFLFSSVALTSAIFVIYSKNTVYSVFFLILVFSSITGLLLVSEIEFLAIMLVIIYIGAITVLFLFVVMMLDINIINENNNFGYIPIIFFISFIFFLETFLMFSKIFTTYHYFVQKYYLKITYAVYSLKFEKYPLFYQYLIKYYNEWIFHLDKITNIETIGQVLYTYYAFFFVIAGLILLIALIGAVTLTIKEKKKNNFLTKDIYQQLSRNSFNAVFKIKKINIQP